MPTAERLMSFYERSEGKLSFSVKANRLLTHEIGIDWQVVAKDFKEALKPLNEKERLSAVLFQLSESFHYTNDNRIYLAKLIGEFEGFPVMVEFRHKEWIRESVFEGLEKRKAGIVFCDMPMCHLAQMSIISTHANGAKATYTAGESPNGSDRYCYDYSDEELAQFVPIIKQANREGKKVQVYFNNHPNGSGAINGLKLKEMVGMDEIGDK